MLGADPAPIRACIGARRNARRSASLNRVIPVRLVVDLNRCQGYAQCAFLAPNVFELHGEEALLYDAAPAEADHERVWQATAACPVQAITTDDGPYESSFTNPQGQ
jgi:ferredoxin